MRDKALPIGYIEIQRAWVGMISLHLVIPEKMGEIKEQAAREYPGLVQHSSRLEQTVDGAGVEHFCLYVGFAPKEISSEPLDPRNLNNAEHADQIGDPGRDLAIGMKEQKF